MATPEILPNPTVEAKTADNASKRDIPFSEFFFNKSENPLLIFFIENGLKNPLSAISGATDFLHLVGLVSLGFIWSKKAKSAQEYLKNSPINKSFLEAKILTGSYFLNRQLPETQLRLDKILTGEKQVMSLAAEQF